MRIVAASNERSKESYTSITTSDDKLKALFKEALVEVLEQHREWFSTLMVEALEDMALVQAIKEGEHSEEVGRDEVFKLLGA